MGRKTKMEDKDLEMLKMGVNELELKLGKEGKDSGTKPLPFEKEYCRQCKRVLQKSYEKRYGLCDRCQAPDEYGCNETDDGLFRKKRTFEYVE